MSCRRLAGLAVPVLVSLTLPGSAWAAPSAGGAAVPDPASVTAATCASGEAWACRAGQDLELSGGGLDGVETVIFLGAKGPKDDRRAVPRGASPTALTVLVPRGARSGRLRLVSPAGGNGTTRARLRILPGPAPQADVTGPAVDLRPGEALIAGSRKRAVLEYTVETPSTVDAVRLSDGVTVRSWPVGAGAGAVRWDGTVDKKVVPDGRYELRLAGQVTASQASTAAVLVHDAIFPIRGKHDLGQSDTNNFGGSRGHGGQDMFAACGTPLVAVRPSVVQFEATQDRAGNYVVLQDATGQSYAYMHLRDRALVKKGARVQAGQRIGYVGETGRASGCHLHFEMWTAPGWYSGGAAVDPLPELRRWDAFS